MPVSGVIGKAWLGYLVDDESPCRNWLLTPYEGVECILYINNW